MEGKNKSKGNFSYGFFLALLAWLLSLLVMVVLISFNQPILEDERWGVILWNGGISLVIWIPLALIAGNIAMKEGNDQVKTFIISSFFITTLIIGGCAGLFDR